VSSPIWFDWVRFGPVQFGVLWLDQVRLGLAWWVRFGVVGLCFVQLSWVRFGSVSLGPVRLG